MTKVGSVESNAHSSGKVRGVQIAIKLSETKWRFGRRVLCPLLVIVMLFIHSRYFPKPALS